MQRRIAQLPLHSGKAPPWLFRRMTKLAGAITMAIVDQFGPEEMLRRLSDPWWFQAFGCVLGFDWHSSGLTTVTCGALKEAAKQYGADLGILVAGGKGVTSRKTPGEIADAADRYGITSGEQLIYASRMSAKVDSAAVQDGFTVYQHTFFFTPQGRWCVVQQGMDPQGGWARRYHWLAESVDDFVCEPHEAIQDLSGAAGQSRRAAPAESRQLLLNMVAEEAEDSRRASTKLACEHPDRLRREVELATRGPTLFAPARHPLLPVDVNWKRLEKIVTAAYERQPEDFETLLGMAGVGAAAIRSLALLAEIIFHASPSHRDPAQPRRPPSQAEPQGTSAGGSSPQWADYSYAHGGKDGTPFPVDRRTYDRNILVLNDAVRKARLGQSEKMEALRRLAQLGGR